MGRDVPVAWTKGQPDPNAIKAKLKSSRDVLDLLEEIIQDKKIKASRGHQPDFSDAGWPMKAADLNGYLRALEEIEKIIPKS